MASMDELPKGTILMWYGKKNELPKGWKICDGKEGRPDLNGKFPLGTTDFEKLGKPTGGKATHSHGGTTANYIAGSAYDVDPYQHHPGTMAIGKDARFTLQTDDQLNMPPSSFVIFLIKE